MGLTLITAPAVEPVSLDEQKLHSRIQVSTEDEYIEGLILAARGYAETFTNRALITQTWEMRMDCFTPTPAFPPQEGGKSLVIAIPKPRLQEIVSVKYIDPDGVEQTFTDFETKAEDFKGEIRPVEGASWPETKPVYDAVKIRFKAGYGDAVVNVPEPIRQGIKMIAGEMYERREHAIVSSMGSISTMPVVLHAEMLMWPYRVFQF